MSKCVADDPRYCIMKLLVLTKKNKMILLASIDQKLIKLKTLAIHVTISIWIDTINIELGSN